MRKNWFLTRDQEDSVKDTVTKLFISSWKFGRDCSHDCPDYANGFGIVSGLQIVGLIDRSEQNKWIEECRNRAETEFKESEAGK